MSNKIRNHIKLTIMQILMSFCTFVQSNADIYRGIIKCIQGKTSSSRQFSAIKDYLIEQNVFSSSFIDDIVQLYSRIHNKDGDMVPFKNSYIPQNSLEVEYIPNLQKQFLVKHLELETTITSQNMVESHVTKSKKKVATIKTTQIAGNLDYVSATTQRKCFIKGCKDDSIAQCKNCNQIKHNLHESQSGESKHPSFCEKHITHTKEKHKRNNFKKREILIVKESSSSSTGVKKYDVIDLEEQEQTEEQPAHIETRANRRAIIETYNNVDITNRMKCFKKGCPNDWSEPCDKCKAITHNLHEDNCASASKPLFCTEHINHSKFHHINNLKRKNIQVVLSDNIVNDQQQDVQTTTTPLPPMTDNNANTTMSGLAKSLQREILVTAQTFDVRRHNKPSGIFGFPNKNLNITVDLPITDNNIAPTNIVNDQLISVDLVSTTATDDMEVISNEPITNYDKVQIQDLVVSLMLFFNYEKKVFNQYMQPKLNITFKIGLEDTEKQTLNYFENKVFEILRYRNINRIKTQALKDAYVEIQWQIGLPSDTFQPNVMNKTTTDFLSLHYKLLHSQLNNILFETVEIPDNFYMCVREELKKLEENINKDEYSDQLICYKELLLKYLDNNIIDTYDVECYRKIVGYPFFYNYYSSLADNYNSSNISLLYFEENENGDFIKLKSRVPATIDYGKVDMKNIIKTILYLGMVESLTYLRFNKSIIIFNDGYFYGGNISFDDLYIKSVFDTVVLDELKNIFIEIKDKCKRMFKTEISFAIKQAYQRFLPYENQETFGI